MCKDIEGEKDQDISECYEAPVTSNNLNVGKDLPEGLSTQSSRSCVIEETLSSGDNSLDFSTSTSPHEIGNDHENDSVKSSVTSNSFVGENDEETISMEEPYSQNNQNEETNNMEEPCCQTNQNETNNMEEPCSQNVDHQLAASAEVTSSITVNAVQEEMAPPKDRKLFAGSNEVNQQSQQNAGCTKKDNIDISSSDGMHNSSGVNRRTEVGEKKVLDSIRNIGQSMLENIQVIETVFQQDKGKFDSLDSLSSNILGSKGQVTTVAALKELRKISNLLQEM
ncbi:TBC1 domain family member protein [Canna indica]|uniref:TBC1 domain family member protein n=1 Tax=Canna indica TaxID=4628 RepID=A0AAQ3QFC9_9LILI|nr:TBC1 domain family member protein [Canna indica]